MSATTIRAVLLVLEIVLAVGALVLGALIVLRNRQVLAEGERVTPDRLRVVGDMLLSDAILGTMAVAAWMLYSRMSWARWMSIVAGAVLMGVVAARPSLTGGRRWPVPILELLGFAVAILAVLLPSCGWGTC